jgi:biotin transport system substrate-specific component
MMNTIFSVNSDVAPKSGTLRFVAITIIGAALLTLSAKAHVPMYPVPMTLQTLAVMAFASLFGWRQATAIYIGYLAMGAAGFPVFSGTPERGIGIAYMMGPTGGFLVGMLIATLFIGRYAYGKNSVAQFAIMLIGLVPIFGFGLAWLATLVPADKVLEYGFNPFILGGVVKAAIAALCAPLAFKLLRRGGLI